MITLGGDAELELVDSLDPFTEGIVFSVRPPKKSWKNISNLSGGEKTLSSLALVFALHYYKPTPLVSEIFSGIENARFCGIKFYNVLERNWFQRILLRLQVLRIKDFLEIWNLSKVIWFWGFFRLIYQFSTDVVQNFQNICSIAPKVGLGTL